MSTDAPFPQLTGKIAEIAEVIGVAAALKLSSELGGQELKLSDRKGGKLAGVIGDAAAVALVEAFGKGEKLTVPMAHLRGQRGRQAALARMMDAGLSNAKAAQAADVHERTARRQRRRLREAAPLPLFDD